MSVISLLYDGYEIIQDTIIEGAYFESIAGGRGGQCRFSVKDSGNIDGDEYGFPSDRVPAGIAETAPAMFRTGREIELRVDDQLVWSGVTTAVSREFFFDVDNTSDISTHQRFWAIEGMDWNVLFAKRVVWNVASPTEPLPSFEGIEQDGDVVRQIMSEFMDLSGDDISDAGVQTVGLLSPFAEPFNVGNPGDQWGGIMNRITASNGAIYYIDPDKVLQYRDVEIATAPFTLSDKPSADVNAVGYRDMMFWLSGDNLANDVLIWGAGKGSEEMVFARVTDDETQDLYGLWQYGEFASDIWKQETVDLRADSYVYGSPSSRRGHRDPLPTITVTVFQPGFRVGQVVNFITHVFDEDTLDGVVIVDPPGTVPPNLANFAARIGHIESNNTYDRQNKSSGAYGCYQIMPGNWRVWGPQFLGTDRSDAESSKWTDGSTWIPPTSEANQDTVAFAKFSNLYDWLGDWRRVAAFWRAGHECIRQPSEWSSGTIYYVNHACVPLGFPPVTTATVLPPVGPP